MRIERSIWPLTMLVERSMLTMRIEKSISPLTAYACIKQRMHLHGSIIKCIWLVGRQSRLRICVVGRLPTANHWSRQLLQVALLPDVGETE